ncbi:3-hydroxy acid dehydrogenase / malonic semialdehyde reductase [Methylacidimicrobium cyclopophantes]|uniref:3-hydroxy acid dehydrogenase / malonic semialdehyde reductase n=1 Tax=Methylacidimicrobium cyclopophantes TaxID=1041766 RepID=A0A5E6MCZ6_9BACT|nr:SDR family oxidoreductase [Methylacidimicrobium cyclopophantes]VVM07091.1 3-hydroxy acid dehydrogenase / malonic semialdehyde reductase [Methylacidimicrobium cyclopophantes]
MKPLLRKTAIVTGASSGIGRATALALAREGANLVATARRFERVEKLARQIEEEGGSALALRCDVREPSEVENVVDAARKRFGGVDILVANAGIMPLSLLRKRHVAEWMATVDINIKGVLNSIAAVLPLFLEQKSGHFVTLSSVAGRKVFPGSAVYCATKYAVRALSEGLRMELSPSENIRVTIIEPGAVLTELLETITDPEALHGIQPYFQEGRALRPEDIASAIVYAVSQPPHVNVNEILIRPTFQEL